MCTKKNRLTEEKTISGLLGNDSSYFMYVVNTCVVRED